MKQNPSTSGQKKSYSGDGQISVASSLGPILVCLSMITGLSGCQSPFFESPEAILSSIETDISDQSFEAAQKKLNVARIQARPQSQEIISYNSALLSILSGECEAAQEMLQPLLSEHESNESKYVLSTYYIENSNKYLFHAQLHQAMGLAILCPTRPFSAPTNEAFESALHHYYVANALGLDVRGQISQILQRRIPSCESFIPDWQKAATTPEHALMQQDFRAPELIICPEGVWIQVDARVHDKITASFLMRPLKRDIWLDDSQKLPFSQLHAEILMAPSGDQAYSAPEIEYIQPLPTAMPTPEEYESNNITLPEYVFKKAGIYYIHLYTHNNGEAKVYFKYQREAQCAYIDDAYTYSPDLNQKNVWLIDGKRIEHLTLCPSRPDRFNFSLEPGQSAMISLVNLTSGPGHEDEVDVQLTNRLDEPVMKLDMKNITEKKGQSSYIQFYHIPNHPMPNNASPSYILVQNDTEAEETYNLDLNLNPNAKSSAVYYAVSYTQSTDCSQNNAKKIIPFTLTDLPYLKHYIHPTFWICPGQSIYLQPTLPENMHLIRASYLMHMLSNIVLHDEDVSFNSILKLNSDDNDYPVENAKKSAAHWTPEPFNASYYLLNPLTQDISFKLTASSEFKGFANFVVDLQAMEDQPNESQDQSPSEQNRQKDQSEKKDSENGAPEKPSEIQTNTKSSGNDTSGNKSQPQPESSKGQASQQDLEQLEKNYIDSLLNDFEQGNYYVPLQGELPTNSIDKPW